MTKKKTATSQEPTDPVVPEAPISICSECFAASDNLKVKDAAPATNQFRLSGDIQITPTIAVRLDLRLAVPNQNRCDAHYVDLLKQIDFVGMARAAIEAKLQGDQGRPVAQS